MFSYAALLPEGPLSCQRPFTLHGHAVASVSTATYTKVVAVAMIYFLLQYNPGEKQRYSPLKELL